MKKANDLSEEGQKDLTSIMERESGMLGLDNWRAPSSFAGAGRLASLLGICHDCANMQYFKREFSGINARCEEYNIRLRVGERITECNEYQKRGAMSLDAMQDIAVLIENKKKKVGF